MRVKITKENEKFYWQSYFYNDLSDPSKLYDTKEELMEELKKESSNNRLWYNDPIDFDDIEFEEK